MRKVSVIITAHNYAKYLAQAIESAANQNYDDFEIIVVNDGSTDYTSKVLASFGDRIKVIKLKGVGLAKACNVGISTSLGEYIIRLDADDFYEENILLVEANVLDRNPNIHLVYSDYYEVDWHGEIIRHKTFQKVNREVMLLDRSPLAAGAMYRRWCYDKIGGYNEELSFQEDYDFWVRFTRHFNVYNVNLPLMYYRKHGQSMSSNQEPRMDARRHVKQKYADSFCKNPPVVLGVIPARSHDRIGQNFPLRKLVGRELIAYSIAEAKAAEKIDKVIVSTDSLQIAEVAIGLEAEVPFIRPAYLASNETGIEAVLKHLLTWLYNQKGYKPDLVVTLQINSPFRRACHIDEAVHTQMIYLSDSVISVYEDLSFHWRPGKYGLTPVIYKERLLKKEKDIVYRENGAIYLQKTNNILMDAGLGKIIGYIEMMEKDSFRIMSEFEFRLAEKIAQESIEEENN